MPSNTESAISNSPTQRLRINVPVVLIALSILKTNKARAIRFSTLEGLCRELDCQPRNLLVYEE